MSVIIVVCCIIIISIKIPLIYLSIKEIRKLNKEIKKNEILLKELRG